MRNWTFTIFLLFSLTSAFSQTASTGKTLQGKIKSANQQIMFATVGIAKANVGTVTNEKGEFELVIPTEHLNKMLTISHIGYNTVNLKLDSLSAYDHVEIELTEKAEFLEEVIVASKKLRGKTKEYGNKKKHNSFIWIQKGDRGSEIVTLIEPKTEIFLNSVSLNILNELEREFLLLLNIYTVNRSTNLPEAQVLRNQKVIRSTLKKGWLEVDLSDENMVLTEPFYIGFQWVEIEEPLPLIGCKSSTSQKSLIRYKALGKWEEFVEWDIKVMGTSYEAP
ncbi:hypothetical protein C9994_04970 [Marivirga lumbricoides]|uniref:Carboxypeptidase-like regulatory domain-containing protein n=1 Tax=Marivirga lumbricoides TaxID=1046115 RepID=A0A2T4DT11_9BACT|nr:hypothetical protein C9994_04970 [Marivirga lumbricoides]